MIPRDETLGGNSLDMYLLPSLAITSGWSIARRRRRITEIIISQSVLRGGQDIYALYMLAHNNPNTFIERVDVRASDVQGVKCQIPGDWVSHPMERVAN